MNRQKLFGLLAGTLAAGVVAAPAFAEETAGKTAAEKGERKDEIAERKEKHEAELAAKMKEREAKLAAQKKELQEKLAERKEEREEKRAKRGMHVGSVSNVSIAGDGKGSFKLTPAEGSAIDYVVNADTVYTLKGVPAFANGQRARVISTKMDGDRQVAHRIHVPIKA